MVTSKPSIFPSASRYELVRSRLQYFITDINVSVYLFYTMLNQVFNSLVPYYRTQKKEFSHYGLTLNIFNSKAKGTPQENMKRTNNPLHLEELKRVCAISKHLIDSAYNKYLVSIESCLHSTPKNFLKYTTRKKLLMFATLFSNTSDEGASASFARMCRIRLPASKFVQYFLKRTLCLICLEFIKSNYFQNAQKAECFKMVCDRIVVSEHLCGCEMSF
jgi:hypothetical protein